MPDGPHRDSTNADSAVEELRREMKKTNRLTDNVLMGLITRLAELERRIKELELAQHPHQE